MRAAATTSARNPIELQGSDQVEKLTLLELVTAVCDVTDDDREVVATVLRMLRSGRVRLCGNFRDVPIREFS